MSRSNDVSLGVWITAEPDSTFCGCIQASPWVLVQGAWLQAAWL